MIYKILLPVLLLSVLASCSHKVYVPAESVTVRTDTVYSAKVRVDSVLVHDSVAMVQRGDTVYYTKYRDRIRVHERVDTVYQAMTDSVVRRVPYPVERGLTRWERTKMDFGGLAIGGLVAMVIAVAVLWIVKIKRNRR